MADKVKLTPPMTDSKTPEWSRALDRAIARLMQLDPYAGRPSWDQIVCEELDAVHSQALLSAYERGRKEGIEEAAKVAFKQAPATQDWADAPLQDQARRTATAIRQLLEVKSEDRVEKTEKT